MGLDQVARGLLGALGEVRLGERRVAFYFGRHVILRVRRVPGEASQGGLSYRMPTPRTHENPACITSPPFLLSALAIALTDRLMPHARCGEP